jgi:hypothetical protein
LPINKLDETVTRGVYMKKKIVVVALISGVLGSSYAQDWDNYGTMNRERHGVSGRFSSDDGDRAFSQFRSAPQEPVAVQSREYQQRTPQYREPQYRDSSRSPEYREPQYREFSRSAAYQDSAYASSAPYQEQPVAQYASPAPYQEQAVAQYGEPDSGQYREQGGTQYRVPASTQYRDQSISPYRENYVESSAPVRYSQNNAPYRQGFDEGNFVMNDQTGEKVVLGQGGVYADEPSSARTSRFAGNDSEWNRPLPQTSAVLPHEDRRISRSASFDDNFGGADIEQKQRMEQQPLPYESQRQAIPQRRENVHDNQTSYRKKPLIGNPFRGITRTFSRLFGR